MKQEDKPIIQVSHLGKRYGKTVALHDVSFNVKRGELFGIIGPDGSGKTTLFRLLTTLLAADEGQAELCGFNVLTDYRKIRQRIGYMPGRFSLYQDLTVEENLTFFATVFHTTVEANYGQIKEIYEQIAPFRHRRAGALSGGMKQKLALCCALIHNPEILFLDEPTTGVDPVSRKELWQMLHRLQTRGVTIVVSTPSWTKPDAATVSPSSAKVIYQASILPLLYWNGLKIFFALPPFITIALLPMIPPSYGYHNWSNGSVVSLQ